MKLRNHITAVLGICFLAASLLSCGDDSSGGGGSEDESVTIDNEVSEMQDFPTDAQEYEADAFSVNGEEVSGTDSARVDDTDTTPGNTSVTIPANLSRAGESITVFGYWFNGSMTKTPATTNFDDLMTAIQTIFSDYVDTSATDQIKIDEFPLFYEAGENYVCFYFEDSAGNKYRTPVVAVKYNPGGVDTGDLLKEENLAQ